MIKKLYYGDNNEEAKYYDLSWGKSTFKQAQKERESNGKQIEINGIY
jgi:hypothetical protein